MESRGASRHTACKACRDRKVRCDGAQPACEKCRRIGEECIYLQAYKPAKADLAQMVEVLQQRLGRAEAHLQRIDNQPNRGQSSFSPDFAVSAPLSLSIPFMSPDDSSFPSGQSNFMASLYQNASKPQSPEISGSEFSNCLPSGTWMTSRNETGQFQMEDAEMDDNIGGTNATTIPSLWELREMNSAPTRSRHWSLPTQNPRRTPERDETPPIPTELKTFLSDMFAIQAEIAGISHVAAEYLAWMRKAPSVRSVEILQALECRLREIHEMAETKNWIAYKDLASALDPVGRIGLHLGEDVGRRAAELKHFFRTDYNFCMALSDQRRPQTGKSGRVFAKYPSISPESQRES